MTPVSFTLGCLEAPVLVIVHSLQRGVLAGVLQRTLHPVKGQFSKQINNTYKVLLSKRDPKS